MFAAQAADAPATLILTEAEQLALQDDPMLARSAALAQAYEEAAVADGELPDPKFKVSLFNFPADTFEFDQEPVTQLRFGVQQAIPRGDTLQYKSERTRALAGKARAGNAEARLKIQREVRKHWLERYYWIQAGQLVRSNRRLFNQLVDITQSQYAAGRRNQQDVLRAELELGLLDDRLNHIQQQDEAAQAALAKWIGQAASRDLPATLPELPTPPQRDAIKTMLPRHPLIRQSAADIEASNHGMKIAREAYKPAWSIGVDYGIRDGENAAGDDRPDFVAATLVFDMPLFTAKRQDKRLEAARLRADAARNARDDEYRELKRMLDDEYGKWLRQGERVQRYNETLIRQARENTTATYNAYQSDATDFATLMRANITELNTRLQALRLQVDRAKTQAQLLYLAGVNS
ncbi:MAG: TolC family protein [Granulosicoccaceae bacterium]